MKRLLLATVALTAFGTVAALAADLPARMPTKAPAMIGGYNWTGFYLGVNAGGAWGSFDVAGANSDDLSGFAGGGQIGYNWQAPGSPIVFGIEADAQGSSQRRTVTVGALSASEKLPFFGTVRGRLGFAQDRWMIYATGGLSYQTVELNVTGPLGSASSDNTKAGYAVGGGVEWALWDRWTTKVEYLYLDSGNTGSTLFGTNFNGRITNNVVRAGLNYRF
jgi:outer membrane immunogenic protein